MGVVLVGGGVVIGGVVLVLSLRVDQPQKRKDSGIHRKSMIRWLLGGGPDEDWGEVMGESNTSELWSGNILEVVVADGVAAYGRQAGSGGVPLPAGAHVGEVEVGAGPGDTGEGVGRGVMKVDGREAL